MLLVVFSVTASAVLSLQEVVRVHAVELAVEVNVQQLVGHAGLDLLRNLVVGIIHSCLINCPGLSGSFLCHQGKIAGPGNVVGAILLLVGGQALNIHAQHGHHADALRAYSLNVNGSGGINAQIRGIVTIVAYGLVEEVVKLSDSQLLVADGHNGLILLIHTDTQNGTEYSNQDGNDTDGKDQALGDLLLFLLLGLCNGSCCTLFSFSGCAHVSNLTIVKISPKQSLGYNSWYYTIFFPMFQALISFIL